MREIKVRKEKNVESEKKKKSGTHVEISGIWKGPD